MNILYVLITILHIYSKYTAQCRSADSGQEKGRAFSEASSHQLLLHKIPEKLEEFENLDNSIDRKHHDQSSDNISTMISPVLSSTTTGNNSTTTKQSGKELDVEQRIVKIEASLTQLQNDIRNLTTRVVCIENSPAMDVHATKPLMSWTTEELEDFLKNKGLAKEAKVLKRLSVDGKTLKSLFENPRLDFLKVLEAKGIEFVAAVKIASLLSTQT